MDFNPADTRVNINVNGKPGHITTTPPCMKRKKFIFITSAAVLAVASVPLYNYYKKKSRFNDPLITPDELNRFCDEKTIYEIGVSYRSMVPAENEKKKLTELLLTGEDGTVTTGSNDEAVFEMLNRKIRKEFNESKLQVVKGWVISTTEARQCALFSLT